ncbi:MAG: acyl-CoA dehydrogenase family protein [Myxococcales bacterium]|nr:acyl-CoA dehydrogenase family protein [Myxococcales bacterium]
MLLTPRILDRELGTIGGDRARWVALETRLAGFREALEREPVDESDEDAATRTYVSRLAGAGLLALMVPAEYGGAAERVSSTAICLTRQWLARTSGALDTAFVMQGLGSYPVTLAGRDELRATLLPKVARGEAICAFALTEPGAGSDIKAMQTIARPGEDGGVVLDGEKCFISNAGVATSYVVFAREQQEGEGGKPRFGAFWVPGDAPGLSVERAQVIAPHPIGAVRFDGVRVPAAHRLGERGHGLRIALGNLDVFRVSVGAAALGLADRALEVTVEHLQRRVQFGKPLARQQGLQFALADVCTDHVAAQLLVYRAAAARDRQTATPDQAAMAKMYATESAQRAIDRAVQSLGGLGVTVGQVPERLYREIRALRIYEGTTEIQKLVIARALLA